VVPYPVTRDRDRTRRLDLTHEPKPHVYGLVGSTAADVVVTPRNSPPPTSHSRTTSDARPDSVIALIGPSSPGLTTTVASGPSTESSLAQLSMQAEIADLRSQNEFQINEQQRLERELKKVEERSQQQQGLIRQLQSSRDNVNNNTRFLAAPKHSSSSTYQPCKPSSSKASSSGFNNFSSSSPPSNETSTAASRCFAFLFPASGPRSAGLHDPPRGPPTPSFSYDDDRSYTLRLQREYDAEDHALAVQRNELSKAAQRVFQCGICMDDMPEDSMACPDSCGHMFCRECLRRHVSTRLEEHRFPILCPTCTAGQGNGKGVTGGRSRGYSYILLKFTCLS
jgi:hypothetical protein